MAQITKWALFWRALVLSLLFGQPAASQSDEETAAWNRAVESGQPEDFFRYLSQFPAGVFVDEAVDALSETGAIGTRSVGALPQRAPQSAPQQAPQQTSQPQSQTGPSSTIGGGVYR